MARTPDERSGFSEDEVRRILAIASEREQDSERALLASGASYSLAEVESIAAEVGIDARHVRAAAADLARGGPPTTIVVGLPSEIVEERWVPSEVDAAAWDEVVALLRRTFRTNGVASDFGSAREWHSSSHSEQTMPVHVRLETVDGETRITVRRNARTAATYAAAAPLALGLAAAVMAGLGISLELSTPAFAVAALLAALGVVSAISGLWAARRWSRGQADRFRAFVDGAESILLGGGD